jgi:hypothetical protein
MTVIDVISVVFAAIAAVAACVAVVFGYVTTKEGREAVAEAMASRREAERERKLFRYERIASLNEDIFSAAFDIKERDTAVPPYLRVELNKLRSLVVRLQDKLPACWAAQLGGTVGDVVHHTSDARHEIALRIDELHDEPAEIRPAGVRGRAADGKGPGESVSGVLL